MSYREWRMNTIIEYGVNIVNSMVPIKVEEEYIVLSLNWVDKMNFKARKPMIKLIVRIHMGILGLMAFLVYKTLVLPPLK